MLKRKQEDHQHKSAIISQLNGNKKGLHRRKPGETTKEASGLGKKIRMIDNGGCTGKEKKYLTN